MAAPVNTYSTTDSKELREDLSGIVSRISPTTTIVYSAIAKQAGSLRPYQEWLTDELDPADANDVTIEGDDATPDITDPAVRLGNHYEIRAKYPTVSGSQQSLNPVGGNAMERAVLKKALSMRRDVEAGLLSDNAAVARVGLTGAGVSAGLGAWLSSTVEINADSDTPVLTAGAPTTAPTAGTPGALTEDLLAEAFDLSHENGGKTRLVLGSYKNVRTLAGFAGNATRETHVTDNSGVILGVNWFVSQHGKHMVKASQWMGEGNVYLLDPTHLKYCHAPGRLFKQEVLGKTGDNLKRSVIIEGCLKVTNPKAHVKIYTIG